MRRLWLLLILLPMLGFSQALQRQFFTTNTGPWVLISPGTNIFVTYHLLGGETNQFVIDAPAVGGSGQTNLCIVTQGTNCFVHSTTNSGVTTYVVDVPTQPQQTNWALANITNLTALEIAWQQITNISTIQIPYAAITNPPTAQTQWPLSSITNLSSLQIAIAQVTNLPAFARLDANNNWTTSINTNFVGTSGITDTNLTTGSFTAIHGGWFIASNGVTMSYDFMTNASIILSNATTGKTITLTNGTGKFSALTASRMVLTDSGDNLSSAAAGGAVPINADGSQSVLGVAFPDALTNGDTRNVSILGAIDSTNTAVPNVVETIYRSSVVVNDQGSSAASNVVSVTIGANRLALDKACAIKIYGDWVQNAGSTTNLTITMKLGNSTVWAYTFAVTANAARVPWRLDVTIWNAGVFNSQVLNGSMWGPIRGAGTTGQGQIQVAASPYFMFGNMQGTASENSANDMTFTLVSQWASASVNCEFKVQHVTATIE